MPFKSEKQRRYLFANEPEIARDWADTYGSRIQKSNGGITNTKQIKGQPHLLAYITPNEVKKLKALGGQETMTKEGIPAYPEWDNYGVSKDTFETGTHKDIQRETRDPNVAKESTFDVYRGDKQIGKDYDLMEKYGSPEQQQQAQTAKANITKFKEHKPKLSEKAPLWVRPLQGLSNWTTQKNRKYFIDKVLRSKRARKNFPGLSDNYLTGVEYWDDETLEKAYQDYMANRLSGQTDAYGNKLNLGGGGGGGQQQPAYMNDPAYLAFLRSQQGGTGDEEVEEEVVEESDGIAGTVYPYQFYGQPDYETSATFKSYLARGGRVPAAFGGIMDTETGRRGYFLGSIKKAFKGVAKAAGKVLKSDIGKMALLGAGIYYGGGGRMPFTQAFKSKGFGGFGVDKFFSKTNPLLFSAGKGKNLGTQVFDPLKMAGIVTGIGGLMGTKAPPNETSFTDRGGRLINPLTQEEDTPQGIRTSLNAAIEEAGDDPNKIAAINAAFPFLNLGIPAPYENYAVAKDGGRIGYAGGGNGNPLPEDPTKPINPFAPKPTGPVLPEKAEQNLEQELLSKFPGLKDLTAEDNAALDAILSPTVKQALGKVIPELEPIFSQFGTNEPNVIMPVSIVSNYAMRKYGGNQNEALAAFVDDVSGQMEQQTNVPPSQGLMTSPQTT